MNNQLGIILMLLAASNLFCGVSMLLFFLTKPKQEERDEERRVEYDREPKRIGHAI